MYSPINDGNYAIFHICLSNPFVWDGSDWGTILESNIHAKVMDVANNQYILIRFDDQYCYCVVKPYNKFTIIFEKLKSIFNIEQLGYHTFTLDRKRYIARPAALSSDGRPITYHTIDLLSSDSPTRKDPAFREQVRRILAFRNLLSISSNFESHIATYQQRGQLHIVSINEVSTPVVKGGESTMMSRKLIECWFNDVDINHTVAGMVGYSGDISGTIYRITTSIETIILSVDPELVWYGNFITNRLMQHLLQMEKSLF